jgi:hypothetical protein
VSYLVHHTLSTVTKNFFYVLSITVFLEYLTTSVVKSSSSVFRLTSRGKGVTQINPLIQAQNLKVKLLVVFKSGESLIFVNFFF